MASEDTDELVSGLPAIHGLCDLRDLDETFSRHVPAGGDKPHAVSELLEVQLLGAPQRMLFEERNHRLEQIVASPHDVAVHVLPVVVIPPVRDHIADAEELTDVARGTRRQRRLA